MNSCAAKAKLRKATDVVRIYLAARSGPEGLKLREAESELDSKREAVIENELKPLVARYLANRVGLETLDGRLK